MRVTYSNCQLYEFPEKRLRKPNKSSSNASQENLRWGR